MNNLNVCLLLLTCSVGVLLAQQSDAPIGCLIDGVDVLSIPKGDAFIINATVYDNIERDVLIPSDKVFQCGRNVSGIRVLANKYVKQQSLTYRLLVSPINEETEISHPGDKFYNFTILLFCDEDTLYVDTLLPIHETNTYTPVFSSQTYDYALFSSFVTDFDRIQDLNPITARDNDISNTEVIFSIENNAYFDLQYESIVPGSLNKVHRAKLIPKKSSIDLTEDLELTISVTDLGYPPKSSNATLRVKPMNIKFPSFKNSYYIGDYYTNNTFVMRSQPELKSVEKDCQVTATLDGPEYQNYFYTNVAGDGTIEINKSSNLPEIAVDKYNFLIYTLSVSYTYLSLNNYSVTGNTTVMVELHS